MPPYRRILLCRLRFMGDVILTTPLIRQMRRLFPDAHIAYLTDERFAPLLEHNPHLNDIIPVRVSGNDNFFQTVRTTARLMSYLRRQEFDLTIDLFGNPRTALQCWITGAATRVGGDFRGRRRLYTVRVPQDNKLRTAIGFHWKSFSALGLELGDNRTEVFLSDAERAWAKEYLSSKGVFLNQPIVGFHPGATWPNKRWPAQKFGEVAKHLLREGIQIVITQGPNEREFAEAVAHSAGGASRQLIVLDVLNLRQLAAALAQLSVYVANDCGAMHLAVAVGTKTLGIFGPSQPEIWFPYPQGNGHLALVEPVDCRPCHKDYCPLGTLACLENLQPARVAKEILQRAG
jgi:lipopolysaccharide heptosyltransferase II